MGKQHSWDVIGIQDKLNYWLHAFDDKFIEHLLLSYYSGINSLSNNMPQIKCVSLKHPFSALSTTSTIDHSLSRVEFEKKD